MKSFYQLLKVNITFIKQIYITVIYLKIILFLDLQYYFTLDDSITYLVYVLAKSDKECNEVLFNLISTIDEYLVNKKMLRYDVIQYRDSDSLSSFFTTDDTFKDFQVKAFPYIKDIDSYINSFLNSNASLQFYKVTQELVKQLF